MSQRGLMKVFVGLAVVCVVGLGFASFGASDAVGGPVSGQDAETAAAEFEAPASEAEDDLGSDSDIDGDEAESDSEDAADAGSAIDAEDGIVTTAALISVTDGDTIKTTAGNVRVIGIDTPERGECGYKAAAKTIKALVRKGDSVRLILPNAQNDTDHYGRLLRYVETTSGVDIGLEQLTTGNAVARYDSRDGYPAHPREAAYHEATIAKLTSSGSVITTRCKASGGGSSASGSSNSGSALSSGSGSGSGSSSGGNWWLAYSSCTQLKKNTVGDPVGPFNRDKAAEAKIYDWFANGTGNHGDGDDDGLACE